MENSIIGQSIGFIALFFVFLGFKEADDKKLIIYLTIGSFFWGIHFSWLGLVAAAGINFFDIGKNFLGLKYEKNKGLIVFFISSYVLIGIVSYLYTQNLSSLLPTFASIISVIGVFILRGIPLRISLLFVLLVWFIYNIIGGSIAGVTSDIFLVGATIYGIYKIKNKKYLEK